MEERQTCDLAGIWRFEIDKEDRGFAEHWEKRRLTQTITLPGCLQAQGYGDAISEDTPWVQSLYDALWYQRGEYVYAQENGTGSVAVVDTEALKQTSHSSLTSTL